MSDINSTRLPIAIVIGLLVVVLPPYIGDDANLILYRGEGWAQHSSNDVSILLMCFVLAFVEYLVC